VEVVCVPKGPFPKSARLLKHASFDQVYRKGQRHFSADMTVFYLRREPAKGGPRVGFTVPRALGGAVDRNRIKRRMRETVRRNLGRFTAPVDVVINPRKSVLTADFEKLVAQVERAFTVVQQKSGPSEAAV